jgi:hypothetical protein
MLEVLMRQEVALRRAAAQSRHLAEVIHRLRVKPAPRPPLVRWGRRRMRPAH